MSKEEEKQELEQDEIKSEQHQEEGAEPAAEKASEQSPEDKVKELNDKYLRLYSEFENFRRRTAREKLDLMKSAGEDIMTELLPVLDDFERALKSMTDDSNVKALKEGVELVHNKMLNTLKNKGLQAFASIEKEFDPEFHEAVTKIPAPSKKLRGKVVDEIEKGYKLNEKVIRYAKVVVGE